jgi:hypothetical protein
MATNRGVLRVKGTGVVDGNGQRIILKGVRGLSLPIDSQLTRKSDSAPQAVI